jgi:hypothetical protein
METAGKLRMDFSHALIKMPGLFGITSDLIGKHAAHVYLINFNHIYPTKVLNFQRRDQQERLFQIPTTSHFFFHIFVRFSHSFAMDPGHGGFQVVLPSLASGRADGVNHGGWFMWGISNKIP